MYTKNHEEKYRIAVMETSGKITIGRVYFTLDEVLEAVRGLREIYAEHGVSHHVGYVED